MRLPQPTHAKYSNLLTDIERGQIKIPQFQRDFVWSITASAALLDSVVKGYPVGTFIFWATKDRLRSVRDLGGVDLPPPKDGETVNFVLDGQQRLTSLFAALKGLRITRESGHEDDFSRIYVDLNASEDDQIVITEVDSLEEGSYIMLTELLTGDLEFLASFPKHHLNKLAEYKRRIESYEFSIIEVRDVPLDVATEIFTRINVGGKELSLFEIMVAKTYDESREFDLAREFDDFVDKLRAVDYETISDATILQLVSLLLRQDCKKQTILKLGKAEFIDTWAKAVEGIERAVAYFRNTYRIPVSHLLPYSALLAPFGYFFVHHPDKPNADQKKLLEDFFWRVSLAGRYSSAVESKLAQDVRRIDIVLKEQSPDYDWGIDASPKFIIDNGWFNAGRSFVKAILCLYAFQVPKSFSDNAIVTIGNDWLKRADSKNYHHFFPRSFLAKRSVDEGRINNIVNITIVDDYLNKRQIKARAPSDYMKAFAAENAFIAETMKSHLIDDLAGFGIPEDNYDGFLEARAAAISKGIKKRLIPREIDARGQALREDDVDEEITNLG